MHLNAYVHAYTCRYKHTRQRKHTNADVFIGSKMYTSKVKQRAIAYSLAPSQVRGVVQIVITAKR